MERAGAAIIPCVHDAGVRSGRRSRCILRCLSRRSALLLLLAVGLASCSGHRPAPRPPIFPPLAAWKTLVGDSVVAPLAADNRHVFVATRDGAVRALDPLTGEVQWQADAVPGHLSARDGVLLVRSETGAVTSLHPRTGAVRWRVDTGVPGPLPAVLDGERALVAGQGLTAIALDNGATAWIDRGGAETTTPPVPTTARLLTGEKDGTLRCRDRATGVSLWTLRTAQGLLAPPLVEESKRRLFLGTTDRRILEVSLDKGKPGWGWRVGADVGYAGLLLPGRVLFASYDAVLYAFERGGNLAWRGALPSRPLSEPLAVEGRVLVACLENQVVAFDAASGAKAGSFTTSAEIRTPPILAGSLIVLGLRDRSVIAYALAGALPALSPEGPGQEPAAEPTRPAPPPPVDHPASRR
jgi:outer membrane protein assembly factor BamB